MKLLIATQNKGKLAEYRRLLADLPHEVIGLADIGLEDMDVEETGVTFESNARLKAKAYGESSGLLTLADDSGLAVDALDGRPGVYSARYGGKGLDDAGRRARLLAEMVDVAEDERGAHFACVIAVYDPATQDIQSVTGRCMGRILLEERDGGKGFGYDALFQPDGYALSFGELDPAEKNRISHRARAAQQIVTLL